MIPFRKSHCSPLLWGVLIETVNSLSLQGEGDGDGRVVSERRHCPEVARYPAAVLREGDGPETARDLLPDFRHSGIPFRAVVRERGVGAPCEAQDVPSRGGEAFGKVVGVGLRNRPALALRALRDRRHPAAALLQDVPVASRDGPVMAHGQPPVRPSRDLPPRDQQQPAHPLRPRPAVAVGHGLELPDQMGAAELVPAVGVGEAGLPAVVDDDAPIPGDDPDVVDGLASALPVQPPARDRPAGADVDPVVRSVHPQRGPVHVGTGVSSSFPMAAASQGSRAPFRRGRRPGSVASESGRPVIAWIMAAVRTGGTIRAQSGWTAQAAMPGPYRRGPGMVSGNAPVVRTRQRGQSLTPATTRRPTVPETMSAPPRSPCPAHSVPVRSWPHPRHPVTGLGSVTVTVRRLPGSVRPAFGPLPPEPFPALRAVPSPSLRDGGRPELRGVLRVVLPAAPPPGGPEA